LVVALPVCLSSNASPATDNPVNFKQRAVLEASKLPATGRQSTRLNVSQFGRYAVTAHSAQGTAIQYVDRMAGPGEISGTPGKHDGRLDVFLNQGEYKIVTQADAKGTGEVALQAHAFSELNSAVIPQLLKYKMINTALDDYQQRSYWLYLTSRDVVTIEAAGRNLADLRLWKDGHWLVDKQPQITQAYPDPHKPLQICRLNLSLKPGLYLLTAYGGPSQAWTDASQKHPLHIRYGIPALDVAGQRRYRVSVFGTDRFLVPGEANYFQLSLPEAKPMTMSVANYVAEQAFAGGGDTTRINKKSLPPVTELALSQQSTQRIITLTGLAGQPYVLRHFTKLNRYTFRRDGEYWLSTIHSGSAEDSVDATSILTRRPPRTREAYQDSRVIELDTAKVWQRRFNLLEKLTLFIKVPATGKYMLRGSGEGVLAKYRIEPFLTYRPRGYRSPPFEDDTHQWELDAGYYVLTIQPERKGILTLRLAAADKIDSAELMTQTVQGATRYGKIYLNRTNSYTLYMNQQPGVNSGVILRQLPVDLRTALPVTQSGGEVVKIPVTLAEQGRVQAMTLDGKPLSISSNNGDWKNALTLAAGHYEISIRNDSANTQTYSLEFAPQRLADSSPLPPVSPSALAGIPHFPVLTDKHAAYLDLDRQQQATFGVAVNQPALYRLETTGLLETQGNLRTRTNPSLVRRQANGVGRNFLIQTYLRQGDYQLSIQTQGRTRGHLGMVLQQTPLVDGGVLTQGTVARAMMQAGHGLAYHLHVDKAGPYRVRAMGVKRRFNMRLEDKDGWPILKPDIRADVVAQLEPGDYRLILLPEAIDARVVTLFEAIPEVVERKGHGPFRVALNQTLKHRWREPDSGRARTPDVWTFEVPAPLEMTITLDHDMQGVIQLVTGDTRKAVANVSTSEAWTGKLEPGKYQLSLTNLRHNNHVIYRLQITAKEFSVGQTRKLSVPATIPVSIGADNIYEFSSYGDADVRARLLDANGREIAHNDDYINDWNFAIARRLAAGQYQLQIEPLNTTSATTTIQLHSPQAITEKALSLPAQVQIKDNSAHLYPLALSGKDALLVIQADSTKTVGLSIEAKQNQTWRVIGTTVGKATRLLMPLRTDQSIAHRVRVWSLDRRNAAIQLRVNRYTPEIEHENTLRRAGIPLKILPGASPQVAIGAVETRRPGLYRLDRTDNVVWTSQAETALGATDNGLLSSSSNYMWFALLLPAKHAAHPRLKARLLRLGDKHVTTLALTLPATRHSFIDIKSHTGPVLVLADSRIGQVGVQLIDPDQQPMRVDSRLLAVANGSVISARADGRGAMAAVWNAGADAGALKANVTLYRFRKPTTVQLTENSVTGVLTPAQSVQVKLAAAGKQLQLVLPPRTAAILLKNKQQLSTHWTGDVAQSISLDTQADRVLLLYAGKGKQQFRVLATSGIGSRPPAIASGSIYQGNYTARGQAWLPTLPGGKPAVLRIRGDASGVYIENSGRIRSGRNIAITQPGSLQLVHATGRVLAWLDAQTNTGAPASIKRKTLAVDKPVTLILDGATQSLLLTTPEPRLIYLHSDVAMVTRVQVGAQLEQVEAHPYGVDYAFFMPTGETRLTLMALGAGALSGKLDVTSSSATEFSEGFGPGVMLPGGGSALYKFKLEHSGPIGIGVRASSDVINAALLDSNGKLLGRGVVQMPSLSPGWYWLMLTAPVDADPVHAMPVLVGTRQPDSGPPAEVIHEYLNRAGRKLNQVRGKP